MRSQETWLGVAPAELHEWSRTLPTIPSNQLNTGHLRQPTARAMATDNQVEDCFDGTADPNPCAGRIVAGRYRLRTLLGSGGMGSVWLAEDAVLQRAVALKKLIHRDREDRPSALQEARAAARITHSGVVRVYDVALDDDGDWIVMEALSGEPLSSVLRERGRLPSDEVRQIALQLVSGLQAIHAADLVHRDIKPSNVQVCRDGRIVITDFGLSSPRGAWGGLRAGAVAGSLSYMAPETLIEGVFGPASDLYALGVTLYSAVEGRPPFDPGGPLELLDSVLSIQPEPAWHAGSLAVVLDGLLEKDPDRRMDADHARECLQPSDLVPTT
jgi:serine/threonine protein kinase